MSHDNDPNGMKLTLAQRARPSEDVLFQEVGGEAVLLDLSSECYFGLDSVGTRIWGLLTENSSLQRAFDLLIDEYDVDPDRLEADLLNLIARMAKAGLVQVA